MDDVTKDEVDKLLSAYISKYTERESASERGSLRRVMAVVASDAFFLARDRLRKGEAPGLHESWYEEDDE